MAAIPSSWTFTAAVEEAGTYPAHVEPTERFHRWSWTCRSAKGEPLCFGADEPTCRAQAQIVVDTMSPEALARSTTP
jgi:hypothetical protein